ncbi:MAG: hypothetical protein ACTS10_14175 [Kiloniellales bacterium]
MAEFFAREPLFAGTALILSILAAMALIALYLDPRTLDGVGVWLKPFKFAVSLAIFLMTLAWFAAWLPQGVTDHGWYRVYAVAVVVCIALEMIWIGGAAAFGLRSHFNTDIAFLRAVYPVMGIVATCLLSVCLVYGVLILADGRSPLSPALRHAVGLGLILAFLLTVVVAGQMAGGAPPLRSLPVSIAGAEGWLAMLMGWRPGSGDLRPAHFAATHAMQALPLFGLLVDRVFPASAAAGAPWTLLAVWCAALLYAGIVAHLFFEAQRHTLQ